MIRTQKENSVNWQFKERNDAGQYVETYTLEELIANKFGGIPYDEIISVLEKSHPEAFI